MDPKEIGKVIAEARKEAGYTQRSLADILFISDKAVSKWERGLSTPDSSILPKLSMLLDLDIEDLIPNDLFSKSNDWQGLLILRNDDINVDTIIYDKPLIHYLLSYFMLVGITNITIKGINKSYIKKLSLNKYGVNISYDIPRNITKKMIVYDKVLFFGSNITRLFKSYMNSNSNIRIFVDKKELPILFAHGEKNDIDLIKENAEIKNIGRGMVYIPLNSKKQLEDASKFVEIYQNNSGLKLSNLKEIKEKRNLI